MIATVGPVQQNVAHVEKCDDIGVTVNMNKDLKSVKLRSRSNSSSKSDNDGNRRDNAKTSLDMKNVKILPRCHSADSVNSVKPNTTNGFARKLIEKIISQNVCSTKDESNGTRSDSEENCISVAMVDMDDTKKDRRKTSFSSSSPTDELVKVSNAIPALMNLFYNSTTLRSEPWFEIELMNISNLLKSQARLLFYFYNVTKSRVLNSLKNGGYLELVMSQWSQTLQSLNEHAESHSQYFVLRKYTTGGKSKKSHIFGIARLDSAIVDDTGSLPVTYLSLSRSKASVPEWESVQQKSALEIMNNNKARAIVEWFRRTLVSQNRVAVFPEFYVS